MQKYRIKSQKAYEARRMYKRQSMLLDLKSTIEIEKVHSEILNDINQELEQISYSITLWWEEIEAFCQHKFSDDAVVNFEEKYIEG